MIELGIVHPSASLFASPHGAFRPEECCSNFPAISSIRFCAAFRSALHTLVTMLVASHDAAERLDYLGKYYTVLVINEGKYCGVNLFYL